mgnify:CR=1 FL=1
MVVGYGTVIIKLLGITSLKEKRSIVKRLTNELKKRFEVSAIECGKQDSKDYVMIGVAFATINESDCETKINNIEQHLELLYTVEKFEYDFHHF